MLSDVFSCGDVIVTGFEGWLWKAAVVPSSKHSLGAQQWVPIVSQMLKFEARCRMLLQQLLLDCRILFDFFTFCSRHVKQNWLLS